MSEARPAAVVVLAAGAGTRMRSALPKPLHPIAGRSLLGHVLAAIGELAPSATAVVVGHGRDQVIAELAVRDPSAVTVVQAEQRGTGHAMQLAMDELAGINGPVLLLPGDAPLLRPETLRALVAEHVTRGAATTFLTARVTDPTGYGRVIRDDDGVCAIVEERDTDDAQRAITEVATSVYVFDAERLRPALAGLAADNSAGELYLTDVVAAHVAAGLPVAALRAIDAGETAGVNDRVQLAAAARVMNTRLVEKAMLAGVSVLDPATTWIDVDVSVRPDAEIGPNTQLHGRTSIGAGARIGPDCTLRDTEVGAGARVVRAHCDSAVIGPDASVGPFAYLRPGARLGRGAKAGTYVEIKNADLGEGAKVPHLTYVGDADIGEGTNIGASSVFVNYDGVTKHRTSVGKHCRTGSDNTFVAPVHIGDGVYTGAGTVLREDVPSGALAVSAGAQRNITGWVQRRRPGTATANAAQAAGAPHPKPSTSDNPAHMHEPDNRSGDEQS